MHTQDLLIRNFDVDCFAGALLPGPQYNFMICVKVSNLEEGWHEMLVLKLQHVSSGGSGFAVSMQEAANPFVFHCVQ